MAQASRQLQADSARYFATLDLERCIFRESNGPQGLGYKLTAVAQPRFRSAR